MGQLIRLNTANALTQRIRQEVTQRQNRIDQIRDVTTLAIREGGMLQQGVAHLFAATISSTQHEIDAARRAGKMTPAKERALAYYREVYKNELLGVVRNAFAEVHRQLTSIK